MSRQNPERAPRFIRRRRPRSCAPRHDCGAGGWRRRAEAHPQPQRGVHGAPQEQGGAKARRTTPAQGPPAAAPSQGALVSPGRQQRVRDLITRTAGPARGLQGGIASGGGGGRGIPKQSQKPGKLVLTPASPLKCIRIESLTWKLFSPSVLLRLPPRLWLLREPGCCCCCGLQSAALSAQAIAQLLRATSPPATAAAATTTTTAPSAAAAEVFPLRQRAPRRCRPSGRRRSGKSGQSRC